MKKVENIVLWAALILLFAVIIVFVCCALDSVKENNFREACFDAAKQDIIAEYGIKVVAWFDIEEVKSLNRDAFLIFTCIAYDNEDILREYSFAVQIRVINGEVDVDTWQIKAVT